MFLPTPHYNNSILEDMTMESMNSMLKELLSGSEAMRESVLLLKVWMKLGCTYFCLDTENTSENCSDLS